VIGAQNQPMRLQVGGLIDRSQVLSFYFDDTLYEGHPGDTLASALLANGVRLVARSFKYHRPRGIMTDGVEEPSALVQLEDGGFAEPNRRPTEITLYEGLRAFSQHAWPSLRNDWAALIGRFGGMFPAGFYYKTFIAPQLAWARLWEPMLRHLAGLGHAPAEQDPARYDKRHTHCDVLVVGAGPAGLAAALAAGRAGARVILADRDAFFGGTLLHRAYRIGDSDGAVWVGDAVAELEMMPEVQLLPETTVTGLYDDNYAIAAERLGESLGPTAPLGLPRQRLWHIRARQVVLATGASERPLVFPGNDRPGVMLAGAIDTYLHRYAVLPGRRLVLYANNDNAYQTAAALAASGVAVAAIVDPRAQPGEAAYRLVAGMPIYSAHRIVATAGDTALRRVSLRPMPAPGGPRGGGALTTLECDSLAVSGGWNPTLHLYAHGQGRLRFDHERAAFLPAGIERPVQCAGAANGSFRLVQCLAEGAAAGALAAEACGFGSGEAPAMPPAPDPEGEPEAAPLVPAMSRRAARRAFVDLHNDVTAADIALATREGYSAVEHLKRYTTLGMGTDQGKTGNVPGLALLAGLTGRDIGATGTTTFRPPYIAIPYGTLAGRDTGRLADPERVTPLHDWHVAAQAVFEPVGQWQRPRYYPRFDNRGVPEDMAAAVRRECLTVHQSLGLLDASTLGKIEVFGRDAGRFLDRIYTVPMQSLPFGRSRYGVMCRDDGMVFDDGVVTRLAPDHFFVTTTSGNAAAVLDWFEEWLQTEWLDLDVFCTSVTEQWANLTLAGPRAREVLSLLAPRLPLDAVSLPFMRMREADIAGIPARIFRISFSGELCYEINVPADQALGLWEVLMAAGARHGITPYGTEAMHVLRAEKGYIIIGQETDGSVTPLDLGLGSASGDREVIGRRSWARPDTMRRDRKQLVGLLPDDPHEVLPEGAQLVDELGGTPPVRMVGHVTSSYLGPRFGRSFALALVSGGRVRHGETVWAPLPDRIVAARIGAPAFFDIENNRRDS